jgi:hypothetical protein
MKSDEKWCGLLNAWWWLWPRVEMTRPFVLSKLRRILLVGQCRVEMGENGDECLPEVGQNRSGLVRSLGRKGRAAWVVFGRRSSYAHHQRRPACRFLSEPKHMP